MQPSSRRDLGIVLFFTMLLAAPFLGNAFHIDEPFYVKMARHIRVDPARPTAFLSSDRAGIMRPMAELNQHPFLVPYLLAAAMAAGAGTERELRAIMLPFDLLIAAALYLLAARFLRRPLIPVLILIAGPGQLINLQHLMTEKWSACFGLLGLYALVKGMDERKEAWFWGSSALAALATLSTYAAVFIPMTGAACAWLRGRRPGRATAWFMAACAPAALHLALTAISSPAQVRPVWDIVHSGVAAAPAARVEKLRAMLAFTAGGGPVLAFWPHLASGRRIWRHACVWVAAALLFLPIFDPGPTLVMERLLGILWSAGSLAAFAAIFASGDERPRGWELWVPWAASVAVLQTCVYWAVLSRYTLFLTIPLTLVSAQALESRWSRGRLLPWHGGALALTVALGVSLSWVDACYADAQRRLAREWAAPAVAAGRRVYFTGHWGLRHYMEEAGAVGLQSGWSGIRSGDMVVVPDVNCDLLRPRRPIPAHVSAIQVDHPLPLRLMCAAASPCQAGFYSSTFGFLPYAFSRDSVEKFSVVEIR